MHPEQRAVHREVWVDLVDGKGAVGEAAAVGTDLDSAEGAKAVVVNMAVDKVVVVVAVMIVMCYLSKSEEGSEE